MRRAAILLVGVLALAACGSAEAKQAPPPPGVTFEGDVHPAPATKEMFDRLPNRGQFCAEEGSKALNKHDIRTEAMLTCSKDAAGKLRWT